MNKLTARRVTDGDAQKVAIELNGELIRTASKDEAQEMFEYMDRERSLIKTFTGEADPLVLHFGGGTPDITSNLSEVDSFLLSLTAAIKKIQPEEKQNK